MVLPMRSLKNANMSGLISILSSSSCEWTYPISQSPGVKAGVRVNSKKEKQCWKGCDKAPVTKQGAKCASHCCWVSSGSPKEHQLSAQLPTLRREMESAWLQTFALGMGMAEVRKDSFLPVLACSLRGHICVFVHPKQYFSNTFLGCTHVGPLSIDIPWMSLSLCFFLDSLNINWFRHHEKLWWWKPWRGETSGMHDWLLPDSFFLSIIWVKWVETHKYN